jgi:putative ATP-dependent endonuclease of the OLD family
MRILSVRIKGFRSIESADLQRCGGMNVLIGKNNAGKSNVLSAIELVINALRRGSIAGPWRVSRPLDEFTDRNTKIPIEIGIEFDLPTTLNERLRGELVSQFPQVAKSVDQLAHFGSIAFVLAAAVVSDQAFTYVRQVGLGRLEDAGKQLQISGVTLTSVSESVAFELYQKFLESSAVVRDIQFLEDANLDRRGMDRAFQSPKDELPAFMYTRPNVRSQVSRDVLRDVERLYSGAKTADAFSAALVDYIAKLRDKSSDISKREISGSIKTFGGESKIAPDYNRWLMEEYGSVPLMHFRESKASLGREEAEKLLQLKNRRGGPQQLNALQQTIAGLLGVHVDAFKESDQSPAEMDVDQFLVEANGAGIREALRIVLDLELRNPRLVLIEEPEVHLHPGLARVVANYLRQKSSEIQMFVTTHSTEFVDSVVFQNAYLVSRDTDNKTRCQLIDAEDEALRIPSELGLRLSTVFMFDRLVFVEGPSDEAVLRIFSEMLGIDLTARNIGFVHMGGIRNFAHYAAEATLDLLSRRQVMMWFVADHDEMDDSDVKKMMERLGSRAKLEVLKRRELENYLWVNEAVRTFVCQKLKSAGKALNEPTSQDIQDSLKGAIAASKEDVVRLRLSKKLLTPVYLRRRKAVGTIEETLSGAIQDLSDRLSAVQAEKSKVEVDVDSEWPTRAEQIAPGALVLDRTAQKFGVRFRKENGDSETIARLITKNEIDSELMTLLRAFASDIPETCGTKTLIKRA